MTERTTITLQVRDSSDLQRLLRTHDLDIDCGGPRRLDDGGVIITAFVTQAQLHALRDVQNVVMTEIDIPHKREGVDVGRGDRFDGGRIAPTGLGKKMRHPSFGGES